MDATNDPDVEDTESHDELKDDDEDFHERAAANRLSHLYCQPKLTATLIPLTLAFGRDAVAPLPMLGTFALYRFRLNVSDMPKPDKNDVERLSRGESTRGRIGNRGVGHRLTQKERILFEAAKRQGFLKIPVTGIRKNVINIYRLWCQASDREFVTRS